MQLITLTPLGHEVVGSTVRTSCRVERHKNGIFERSDVLWYEYDAPEHLISECDVEPFLIAYILPAMAEGRSIIANGIISRELLSNLHEFQEVWRRWTKGRFQFANVRAESIAAGAERQDGAVLAFSGGVDACFSAWRHTQSLAGYRSQHIRLATFAHGMDIPLSNESDYDSYCECARTTLASVGVPLARLRTNYRSVIPMNWEHTHVCAIVSALQMFKGICGTILVGSTEPYDTLVSPWGSHPITDPLLSSAGMSVLHDGAGYSRTEKAAIVADWDAGCENLRVCWKGAKRDRNCGTCEKCIRTSLNFIVTGKRVPSSLVADITPEMIRGVTLRNEVAVGEYSAILDAAKRRGLTDPWVLEVERLLRWRRLTSLPRVVARRLRQWSR